MRHLQQENTFNNKRTHSERERERERERESKREPEKRDREGVWGGRVCGDLVGGRGEEAE